MKQLVRSLAAVFALAALVAVPAAAQELPLGTWTGMMYPPGGESASMTYEVSEADGRLAISMSFFDQTVAFHDIELDGRELTFWWEPGVRVDCTLMRQDDGSYSGTCTDGSANGEGRLTMVPPSE